MFTPYQINFYRRAHRVKFVFNKRRPGGNNEIDIGKTRALCRTIFGLFLAGREKFIIIIIMIIFLNKENHRIFRRRKRQRFIYYV